MLEELHIRNLGVVEDVTLLMQSGMTAVTGETGAGKTMLVEALRLLGGARAEPHVVRTGSQEATIDGRFSGQLDQQEVILTRVVPLDGRSRAYVNGRMTTVSNLSEISADLVDLHAQNAHQSLLAPQAQRNALDEFGNIDTRPLHDARRAVSEAESHLNELGGDAQSRAREVDLLRYQLDEIDAANIEDPNEMVDLTKQEELLADVSAHREAAETVSSALGGEAAATELIATALAAAATRGPLTEIASRLKSLSADLDDLLLDVSSKLNELIDDPQLLADVQERRHLLRQIERKYGPNLEDVIAFREESRARLSNLERHDETLAEAEKTLESARTLFKEHQQRVLEQRKKVAPQLQKVVEQRLKSLSLPSARFEINVKEAEVEFGLSANPGMPVLPLAKAASGGELSRAMLALHLAVLNDGAKKSKSLSRTLIFDEVDAGVGGEAAVSIGRSLSELARSGNQVLVVTHLPQVAAFADHQLSVSKTATKNSTTTSVVELAEAEREVELARMLAGRPDSKSGRAHARELMDQRIPISPGRSKKK